VPSNLLQGNQQHGEYIGKYIHDNFVERMIKVEDAFQEEKKEYELKIEDLSDRNNILENRVKELEKILDTSQARYVPMTSHNAVLYS
jgi:tryptophan synthase beta subunit